MNNFHLFGSFYAHWHKVMHTQIALFARVVQCFLCAVRERETAGLRLLNHIDMHTNLWSDLM